MDFLEGARAEDALKGVKKFNDINRKGSGASKKSLDRVAHNQGYAVGPMTKGKGDDATSELTHTKSGKSLGRIGGAANMKSGDISNSWRQTLTKSIKKHWADTGKVDKRPEAKKERASQVVKNKEAKRARRKEQSALPRDEKRRLIATIKESLDWLMTEHQLPEWLAYDICYEAMEDYGYERELLIEHKTESQILTSLMDAYNNM